MQKKATFHIQKMECTAEEQMVRMKLEHFDFIKCLQFDLAKRNLIVLFDGEAAKVQNALSDLKLGGQLIEITDVSDDVSFSENTTENKVLIIAFLINTSFFIIEMVTGYFSQSIGLIADSLDMLADALIYGMSLYAVGKLVRRKKNIAKLAGCLQIILAVIGFIEIVRRFVTYRETPVFQTMIIVSVFALIANTITLILLQKANGQEVHIKASLIVTSNDVMANAGVIIAGVLVYLTHSRLPDLVIGTTIFLLVVKGAYRILQISK